MNKKCPCCGSEILEEGILRSGDATSIIFITKENNKRFFNNKYNPVVAFNCKECGYISLFTENKESK